MEDFSSRNEQSHSGGEISKTGISPAPAELEQLIKGLPSPKKEEIRRYFSIQTTTHFSGPLPSPQILREYEQIMPGAADRIITMAEHQAAHRQTMETAVVTSNIRNEAKGLNYGFILAVAFIFGGFVVILTGRETTGLAALGTGAVGLVAVYLNAKYRSRRELREKQVQAQNPSLPPTPKPNSKGRRR